MAKIFSSLVSLGKILSLANAHRTGIRVVVLKKNTLVLDFEIARILSKNLQGFPPTTGFKPVA